MRVRSPQASARSPPTAHRHGATVPRTGMMTITPRHPHARRATTSFSSPPPSLACRNSHSRRPSVPWTKRGGWSPIYSPSPAPYWKRAKVRSISSCALATAPSGASSSSSARLSPRVSELSSAGRSLSRALFLLAAEASRRAPAQACEGTEWPSIASCRAFGGIGSGGAGSAHRSTTWPSTWRGVAVALGGTAWAGFPVAGARLVEAAARLVLAATPGPGGAVDESSDGVAAALLAAAAAASTSLRRRGGAPPVDDEALTVLGSAASEMSGRGNMSSARE